LLTGADLAAEVLDTFLDCLAQTGGALGTAMAEFGIQPAQGGEIICPGF